MVNEEQRYLAQVDPYLVSPKIFHLEMPLYHELDLLKGTILENVFDLLTYSGTIDAYCIWCEKESVFDTAQRLRTDDFPGYQKSEHLEYWKNHGDGFLRITHRCSRDTSNLPQVVRKKRATGLLGRYTPRRDAWRLIPDALELYIVSFPTQVKRTPKTAFGSPFSCLQTTSSPLERG